MINKRLVGKVGELIAEKYLTEKGFKILYKNWTCHWGEIDMIAEKDNVIIFVEVKYRIGLTNSHPSESMTFYKRRSLQRSINIFLTKNYVVKPWRVDLVCVSKIGKVLRIDYYEYISLL